MRSLFTAAGATIVVLAGILPASGAGPSPEAARITPTGAVVTGELRYGCYGCGPTSISFRGTVQVGYGDLPLDAVVTATGTANIPAATCPVSETTRGELSVDGDPYTSFQWTRVGSALAVTLGNGGSGSGVAAPTTSCGGPAIASVTFTLGAGGSTDPSDATYPDTACLAVSAGLPVSREPVCAGVGGVAINRETGEIIAGHEALASALGLSSHTTTVIGIEYNKANYKSNSMVVVTSNPQGCYNGASYQISGLNSYWNDRISSARSFSGCWSDHYEHWSLTGAMLTCTCSTMGVMDNATTSIKWRP